MAGAVYMGIMPFCRLVFDVLDGDGHTPGLFFRGVIDTIERAELGPAILFGQDQCYRRGQRRLAVVDVTDGAHVNMRF
jgi:hypothetical protein